MRKENDPHPFRPFMKAIQEAIDEAATAFSGVGAEEDGPENDEGRAKREPRNGHCGPRHRRQHHPRNEGGPFGWKDAHGMGVRRPLRMMARQLGLADEQVEEMASILDEIRHARAQVALDQQRTLGGFADAFASDDLDGEKIRQLAAERVKSQEVMAAATVRCLERTHAILNAEQRKTLSMLLRSGMLSL